MVANRSPLNPTDIQNGATQRQEARTDQASIIADAGVKIGAGRYNDSFGIGHAALHVADPRVLGGERRCYLLTREEAITIAQGLLRVAGEEDL